MSPVVEDNLSPKTQTNRLRIWEKTGKSSFLCLALGNRIKTKRAKSFQCLKKYQDIAEDKTQEGEKENRLHDTVTILKRFMKLRSPTCKIFLNPDNNPHRQILSYPEATR